MNHWQMIAIAYGLTFIALAMEVALLFRRRRAAWRQAQDGGEAHGQDEVRAGRGTDGTGKTGGTGEAA